MRRSIWTALVFGLVCGALALGGARALGAQRRASAIPELVAQVQGGRLIRIGSQRVLSLRGRPKTMGRAHGRLLRDDVRRNLTAFVRFAALKGVGRDRLRETFRAMEPHIPAHFLAEMEGIAAGADVPLDLVQDAHMIPAHFHCTGAAAWGRATRSGELFHTRSLDYAIDIGSPPIQTSAILLIAEPADGQPHATPGWAGFVGSVGGVNAAGVAIGEMGSPSSSETKDGMPMVFLVREILRTATTLDDAIARLTVGPRTAGYNFIVSDGNQKRAVAVEVDAKRIALHEPKDDAKPPHTAIEDVVRRSNHFIDPTLAARQREHYDPRRERHGSWTAYAVQGFYLNKRHGALDERSMIDMLRLYPAEAPCLHQAVFVPGQRALWISHAADPNATPHAGAHNQPFYRYRLNDWLGARTPKTIPIEHTGQVFATEPVRRGRVDARALPTVPAQFAFLETGFDWSLEPRSRYAGVTSSVARFPSPYPGVNDDIRAIYYRPAGDGPFPGAVIVHGLVRAEYSFADFIAQRLALQGVAAAVIYMPGYGARKRIHPDSRRGADWVSTPETGERFMRQAVMDIRRAATWFSSLPEIDADRLGFTGLSMGGILGSVAMAVEPRFKRGVLLLAGGKLENVIFDARELRWYRRIYQNRGITRADLRRRLQGYDPIDHAPKLRDRPVMMMNASFDELIRPYQADALWRGAGEPPITWIPAGHYGGLFWLPWMTHHAADHLTRGSLDQLLGVARSYNYGSRVTYPTKGQRNDEGQRTLDCVGFMRAALRRTDDIRALDDDERRTLFRQAAIILPEGAKLGPLVERSDPIIRGVAHALPAAGLGRAVDWRAGESIGAGDVVQYWKPRGNGVWRGHCGIVEDVIKLTADEVTIDLYGSHRSQGGVGTLRVRLVPQTDRLFIARPGR